MKMKWLVMGVVGLTIAACGDEAKKRPLGGVCEGDEDCVSGLCLAGMCLDPEADEDGDGVINRLEGALGSNPLNPDTDYDGIGDADELANFASRDTDGDGVADILESQIKDADEDCLPDELDPDNGTVATDLTPVAAIFCSKNGVCRQSIGNVRVQCVDKSPVCIYDDVPGYESEEATCDGRDNDCDGRADEGYRDSDGDGTADCVDTDVDGDGEPQQSDNCPDLANPDQADADGDDRGDVCDPPALATFGALTSPTGDTTPTVSGTGEPLSIVHVFGDAACTTEVGSGAVSAGGSFSFEVTLSGEGARALYIRTENRAGLESACALAGTITLDLTAPGGASGVWARALSWDESGGTFEIGGVGEPGARVTVYASGTCGGTAVISGGEVGETGTFVVTGDFDNETGAIGIRLTDAAGNVSSCVAGPTLFGDVTISVTQSGKPVGKLPVQIHTPDGAALELVNTDSETGIATATVFAGCAATVPIQTREGYSRWVTIWGLVPGQALRVPVPPQPVIIDESSLPVSYSWPREPEGASYAYIYTPCGSNYAYVGEGGIWIDYYGDCLGTTTFDAVIFVYGNSGLLGFSVARDNPVPANPNSPTDVDFPAWTTDLTPDLVTVRFDNVAQPGPISAWMSERLGLVGLSSSSAYGFAAGGSSTLTIERLPVPGTTWDLQAEIYHLGANGQGRRGRWIPEAARANVVDIRSLPPRVLAASLRYDGTLGAYTGFQFMAESGLAAAVDAGLVDMYFYGQMGSLDWQFVMAPRDDADVLFPTFDDGFPGTELLQGVYYANGGNVTWYDWDDRQGFEDVIAQCDGLPGCIEGWRATDYTSCCGNNRD